MLARMETLGRLPILGDSAAARSALSRHAPLLADGPVALRAHEPSLSGMSTAERLQFLTGVRNGISVRTWSRSTTPAMATAGWGSPSSV